jgi:hypothetical protein
MAIPTTEELVTERATINRILEKIVRREPVTYPSHYENVTQFQSALLRRRSSIDELLVERVGSVDNAVFGPDVTKRDYAQATNKSLNKSVKK